MSEKLPRKILLLASNPLETGRLRLDEEVREIKEALQRASKREQFVIESVSAARYRDVNREILRIQPNIVHFSGHGIGTELKEGEDSNSRKFVLDVVQSDKGGLIVEDESGQVTLVSTKALADLFKLFADTVECVVLNACFSHVQAKAIAEYIPYVVGMGRAIGDRAAIEFAIAFYGALGEGKNYKWAFNYARNAIDLAGIPESDTPKLFHKLEPKPEEKPKPLSKKKEIVTQFTYSNIVPFLGSGINPDFYIQLATTLEEELREDLNGNHFSEKNLITEVIGIPCQFCPYLPNERPSEPPFECPMLKGIEKGSTCPLYMEQTLATASMNLRYLSHYGKLKYQLKPFYTKFRQIIQTIESNNPNKVHELFANLFHNILNKVRPKSQLALQSPLIVTTNYDNLLERAFDAVHQEYDLVYYIADGKDKGKFKHKVYKKNSANIIKDPSKYDLLPLHNDESSSQPYHPIILKLFGTLEDQFVMTQNQLNYLASSWTDDPPSDLMTRLIGAERCSILFLGYTPSDPDLQLLVNRFWKDESLLGSYLVHQSQPGELEKKIWNKKNVELISLDCSLEDFTISLQNAIEEEINKKIVRRRDYDI